MPQAREKPAPAFLKVPPHNIEAEEAILGGILMNNDAMNQIMDILSPGDFYREANLHIFEGMVELYNRGEPIDIITLSRYLTKKSLWKKQEVTIILLLWLTLFLPPQVSPTTPRSSRVFLLEGS